MEMCTEATPVKIACDTLTAAQLQADQLGIKRGVLVTCCGTPASGWPQSFSLGTAEVPKTGGTLKWGKYTDAQCQTGRALTAETDFGLNLLFGATHNWEGDAETCLFLPRGSIESQMGTYKKYVGFNTTHGIAQWSLDSDCSQVIHSGVQEFQTCDPIETSGRRLANHTDGGAAPATHEREIVTGGTAPANLAITTEVGVSFDSLPNSVVAGSDESATIRETTCEAVRQAAATAAAAGETTLDACSGTLALSAVAARRRLASRRLAGHQPKVNANVRTVVPAADASAVKTAMAATVGATDGALNPAVLATAAVDAVKAKLPVLLSNITATATTPVVNEPVVVIETPPSSSTSGAVVEYLSYGVGLIVAAALVF